MCEIHDVKTSEDIICNKVLNSLEEIFKHRHLVVI